MPTSLSQISPCFGCGSDPATALIPYTLNRQEGKTIPTWGPKGEPFTKFEADADPEGNSWMSYKLPSTNGSIAYGTANYHAYVPNPKKSKGASLVTGIGPGEWYSISPNSLSFPKVKPQEFGLCSLVFQTTEDKKSGIPYKKYKWSTAAGEVGKCHLEQYTSGSFGKISPSNFWQMPSHSLNYTLQIYNEDREKPQGIARDILGEQSELSRHRASMVEIPGVKAAWIIHGYREALYWLEECPVSGFSLLMLPPIHTITQTVIDKAIRMTQQDAKAYTVGHCNCSSNQLCC